MDLDQPRPWKYPLIFGSIVGVPLAVAVVFANLVRLIPVPPILATLLQLLVVGLVLGMPIAAALAVRWQAKAHLEFSRWQLTTGQGAGVGARTGLVTAGYTILAGVVTSLFGGVILGPMAGMGSAQIANMVGAGITGTVCSALCWGLIDAALGAVGGAVGALIFAKQA